MRVAELVDERFWKKVQKTEGCWLWTGGPLSQYGYSHFWDGKRRVPAHRWSYERLVGPIPAGLQIDHLCRTRHCVNPAHLEPVTSRENTMRGEGVCARNAARRTCPAGHPYDMTLIQEGRPVRRCRECRKAVFARRDQRDREKRKNERALRANSMSGTPNG